MLNWLLKLHAFEKWIFFKESFKFFICNDDVAFSLNLTLSRNTEKFSIGPITRSERIL